MRRLLLAAALVGASFAVAPAASALNCPPGTVPATLPTGTGYCKPGQHCDPAACQPPVDVHCPTDIPVWTQTCTRIFGWD